MGLPLCVLPDCVSHSLVVIPAVASFELSGHARLTEAEKRCVIEASDEAGARYSYLIEEPIAAAIGAGLDINEPTGHMVLDIGGGTTDITVISHGATVISDSIKMAGDKFDDSLRRYMKRSTASISASRTPRISRLPTGARMWKKRAAHHRGARRSVVTGCRK